MSIALVRELTSELLVVGATLRPDIADLVTDWTLDMGVDRTTELSITLDNPSLSLLTGVSPLARGSRISWRDLDLTVAALDVNAGPAGAQIEFRARSRGVQALRRETGERVWTDVSPTELLQDSCSRVGLDLVAETSVRRRTIARTAETGDRTPESTWDVHGRHANELGFWLFEAAGTVYFARPSWLIARGGTTTRWQWPRPAVAGAGEHILQDVPDCHGTDDAPDASVVATLLAEDAVDYRPGNATVFSGIPGFTGSYIVSSVEVSPGEVLGQVGAVTPIDPEPTTNPDGTPIGGRDMGLVNPDGTAVEPRSAGAGIAGSSAVERFVQVALQQAGDRYVWGAGRNLQDDDPESFDCSGLVYWAAGQIGLSGVAGTAYGQWNQCRNSGRLVTVASGVATRGALLFNGDGSGSGRNAITHVAISLGDGNTIEARGTRYGVGVFAANRGFDHAGLLPGLAY